MFSRRTSFSEDRRSFEAEVTAARAREGCIDLTETNPTRVALGGGRRIVTLLGHARGAAYEPDPRGARVAREAVASYYASRGASISPDRVVLTASTSEAYAHLFKLLADPGGRVLVPSPSYPLFPLIAALEGVCLAEYSLIPEERFALDVASLARALGCSAPDAARAIVLVHPNNPTGTFVRAAEADAVEGLAANADAALIADEVFADYAWPEAPQSRVPTFAAREAVLTFSLGGLSKLVGMPQLKLAWIVVSGPRALAEEAMRRLEIVADTFLSVSTPVQLALPEILEQRSPIVSAIAARSLANRHVLDRICREVGSAVGLRRVHAEGGWMALLEVPRTRSDLEWASDLARRAGVIVQPGFYYDLAEGYLALSLLQEPSAFAHGATRLAELVRDATL